MKLDQELPHIRLHDYDGSYFAFPVEQYKTIIDHWTAGKAFYFGHSMSGAPCTIKLGRIASVIHMTQEALDHAAAQDAEAESRKIFSGE